MTSSPKLPDPTLRFSSRVENYIRYRPGYPAEILDLLRSRCGLSSESVITDIGSGTGKLTELFLAAGFRVIGVEPNREMREAGERLLGGYPRFKSVAASAEACALPDASVDVIVAGQAFHWFDRALCRPEFVRVLKPGGWLALIWNDRRTDSTPFLIAYERLLRRFATDYDRVNHRNIDLRQLVEFFGVDPQVKAFPYMQAFDFDGLKGRLLSSSYAPEVGHPQHEDMLVELRRLFDAHRIAGQVTFDYDTRVYLGHLI